VRQDHTAIEAEWSRKGRYIADQLKGIPGLTAA
jgi:hypothetical protein